MMLAGRRADGFTGRCVRLLLVAVLAPHATQAAASYAQVTLPGLGAGLLLAAFAAYALLAGVVLLCRGFRSKVSVAVNTAVVLGFVVGLVLDRRSVAFVFDQLDQPWQVAWLGVAVVALPLVQLAAPVWQYLARGTGASTRWPAALALAVPAALIMVAAALDYRDSHPSESTQARWREWRERGARVESGGMAALLDALARERAWGTIDSLQLLKGVEGSALVRGAAPLSAQDRIALTTLVLRDREATPPRRASVHDYPCIETKLLWDTLEPGGVDRRLPRGVQARSECLVQFIGRHGPSRLCSAGALAAADRAALERAMTAIMPPPENVRQVLDDLAARCRMSVAGG